MSSPLRRLFQYARGHRKSLLLASTFSVLNKIFDIAPEILLGVAIDVVVAKEDSFVAGFGITDPWNQILFLAVLTLIIWVGESMFEYLFLIYWRGLAQSVQHDLRNETYRHVQNLDLRYFEDQSTGNLVSILNDDINQLERFLDGGANQLIQTLTAVVGVGAVFFVLSPTIAVLAFLPIPAIVIGAFYFQKKALPLYADVRSRVGDLSARLNNNLSGILTVKSFTAEKREAKILEESSFQYVESNKKAIAVSSAFIPVIRMAILCGFLLTFVIGAKQVFAGEIAVGAYGVLIFLTQRLLWPLTNMAATVDLYQRAMASTKRILDLLKTPIDIQPGSHEPAKIHGDIQFNDVSFQYSSGPVILDRLSFKIQPLKTTAFVGSTGSGKSTLVKLILRFYDPNSGEIKVDGKNLKAYSFESLRSRVGLVSQDVFLFHGTVRENIAFGVSKATDDEIIEAAKKAEAHDFISSLSSGYDTVIGERGQKLSGGQKQRLSIARALIKEPDILILDEATSAVDNETEAAIQRSLAVISKNRTTIVIAHRLSTIVNADRIFVLESGQIKESGIHKDLIEGKGFYHQLWNVQTGSSPL